MGVRKLPISESKTYNAKLKPAMENLKVVSAFEYAITEICDPEAAKKMRPRTRAEENANRAASILGFLERVECKDGYSQEKWDTAVNNVKGKFQSR